MHTQRRTLAMRAATRHRRGWGGRAFRWGASPNTVTTGDRLRGTQRRSHDEAAKHYLTPRDVQTKPLIFFNILPARPPRRG